MSFFLVNKLSVRYSQYVETMRIFLLRSLRLCVFTKRRAFSVSLFCGKKEKGNKFKNEIYCVK